MIDIIGTGAIGTLLAGYCHLQKFPYRLLAKTQSSEGSLQLLTGEELVINKSTTANTLDEHISISMHHFLMVPVKAFQVEHAITMWKDLITPNTVIVLANNGMGTEETLLAQLPDNPIARMITSRAAKRAGENKVEETGIGPTHIGWLRAPEQNKALYEDTLSVIWRDTNWHSDINPYLWQKLAINAVINPMTALHQITNGELSEAKYQDRLNQLISEVHGVLTTSDPEINCEELTNVIKDVINNTASNHSSMCTDIANQQTSEIDYITGYLIEQADKLNVDVSENKKLYQQIKDLENGANHVR